VGHRGSTAPDLNLLLNLIHAHLLLNAHRASPSITMLHHRLTLIIGP